MKRIVQVLLGKRVFLAVLAMVSAMIMAAPQKVWAQPAQPVAAIHNSELTRALEAMPGVWWPSWHYFVLPESMKEALRSDGTPFVEVSDADIAAGRLLNPDGSPKYPILISLASEAASDGEVAQLRDYVAAGGFLFVGSSAFTRIPDGSNRGDFALANEMGLHMVNPSGQNWTQNLHFAKTVDHRLVADIPAGTLAWRMPLSAAEIPLGVSPTHKIHGSHYVFQVLADTGTTVLANGDAGPLLATRPYRQGNFIYHSAAQPLIGHTIYDPALYAYLIYRHAIEWAFEAFHLPLIKLSPWRFEYNSAFVVRHDFENFVDSIRAIESSAAYEKAAGAKGDYYFCTGTLRDEMADKNTVVASLRRAVTNSGATIGAHNGGLRNPNNSSLNIGDFDYWHWGPDEALDITPPGYNSGKDYAHASLSAAFQDVEGWLAGVDNGRAGCGSTGDCPRIWAAPYMNSTREDSRIILEALGTKSMGTGEQKIGPFPHWALSYETPGKLFSFISEPTSDWYVGDEIPGALEWGHTANSMRAAVDFYYDLGAPINLYGHIPTADNTLMGQYVQYCAAKPRMWATNAVGIADWWKVRSNIVSTPSFSISGSTVTSQVTLTGATDPETSIEVAFPTSGIGNIQVFLNGVPADPADYRIVGNAVKVRAGVSPSVATVQYTTSDNPMPTTTGLNPAEVYAGGADFLLTVNGSGFVIGSVVQWNGASRATTYASATELTALVPAADIASAGTATVTVFNPAPGGGTSNGQTFTITPSPIVTWTQTDWINGGGQFIWSDAARYDSAADIDSGIEGRISLVSSSTITVLLSDGFSDGTLSPWVASMGTWTETGGVLQGSGGPNQYSYASLSSTWTDYVVQGNIQLPAGSFGGGIGGRLDPATGAHYGAWIYPDGSAGGSNRLKLWKFAAWTDIGAGVPLQEINLPSVGTGWHTLRMTFLGSRILVHYDGSPVIDVTDTQTPYLSGGISADFYTGPSATAMAVDDISVSTVPGYVGSGALTSSAYDGGNGVQWQTISWDAVTGGGTNVCVRTRTASAADQLASASWSACYASGSTMSSMNYRWMQYRIELNTSEASASPVLNEIRISYIPGTSGSIPVISSMTPASAVAGGPEFTLTVNGSGFVDGSRVLWNDGNRATTYVSPTRLTAAIAASDISAAGTASVTVENPAPGGGVSNARIFTINNPAPQTTGISPASAMPGGSGFTLTVDGTYFLAGSVVRWNGVDRATTYVSSSRLTAAILAADIASAGTAQVTVFSPAPGGGTSNPQTFTVDNTPPALVISAPSGTITSGGPISYIVDYSGADIVTLAAADVTLNKTGTANGTVEVSGTGMSTRTVTITGITGDGTLGITIAAGTARDTAGNTASSAGPSATFSADHTAPDTTISSQPSDPTNQTSATFTFTATETVSAFECRMDGGSYASCASPATYDHLGSNATHTFEVRAIDLVGNTDETPATYSWVIDTEALGMTIATTASNPTRTSPIPVTVHFSKPVKDFIADDVALVNGAITDGSFSGVGADYSFAVTPSGEGLVTVNIAAGAAHDKAGNANGVGSLSLTYATTAPDTTIATQPANPTIRASASFTFTATEAGSTFECRVDGGSYAPCTNPKTYSGLASNATHTFDVRAIDPAGNTDLTPATYSWAIVASTISFDPLPAKTYGDADFAPAATANSGLPVSFSSSNESVATIAGGKIHIVSAGTATITASQAGDANYSAAEDVRQLLTVNPAMLTVTADGKSKTYGTVDPLLTYTATGFVNGDTGAIMTGTLARAAGEGVGSYAINRGTVSAGANYAIVYYPESLTINKAPATVTPNAQSKIYGAPDPLLTGTLAGFLQADNVTATYGRTAGENAGTYTISAVLSPAVVLANYLVTYNTATFTIVKADQAISFGPLPIHVYGEADFAPGATASSGLAVTYSSSNKSVATIVGGSIHIKGVGTTTITARQAGDNNYNAAANVQQRLTIIATPVVTVTTPAPFGPQVVRTVSAPQAVTVTNTGGAPVTITGISIGGTNPLQFNQTNNCPISPATLAAGASCQVAVTFAPTKLTPSVMSAVLRVDVAAPSASKKVSLSGTVIAVPVVSETSPSPFEPQVVHTASAPQTVTVTNTGAAPVTITGIGMGGTNPLQFTQSNNCPVDPATLAAGASCEVAVTFAPTKLTPSEMSAVLRVDVAPPSISKRIPLSGTVVAVPVVTVTTPSPFGPQVVHTASAPQTVTVTNTGGAPVTITGIGMGGTNPLQFTQTNNCPVGPATLAAGASCEVAVTFAPTKLTPSEMSAVLRVDVAAPSASKRVPLSGTVESL